MTQKRKYFGTDGIRGKVNEFPMTAEMAYKVAIASAQVLKNKDRKDKKDRQTVVIGSDTRISATMIGSAMIAGFNSVGIDVITLGILSTPAVAFATKELKADFGVMISASHNPFHDNGIKFFKNNGHKLTNEIELEIEAIVDDITKNGSGNYLYNAEKIGKLLPNNSVSEKYIQYIKTIFPEELSLNGLKVVIDCANGSAYKMAPALLKELGADIYEIGTKPDGYNINEECGSTHPENLVKEVIKIGADIGIALDGDADRIIIVDENGKVLSGDNTIALIAKKMLEDGRLKNNGVAVTKMSNLAFEHYIRNLGCDVTRTDIGDRYVFKALKDNAYNLGGEDSGHIIMLDYATTGDGLAVALKVLSILAETKQRNKNAKISEIANLFTPMPQVLKNAKFDKAKKNPLEVKEIQELIKNTERELEGSGRLLIRKSGTQPLIRVMIEGEDENKINEIADNLVEKILEANK